MKALDQPREGQAYIFVQKKFLPIVGINPSKDSYVVTIPEPEKEVFRSESETITEHLTKGAEQATFEIEGVDYPKEEDGGGIFVRHQSLLFPAKGFPTPKACQANNMVKRVFIGQVRYLAQNPLALLSFFTKKGRVDWLDVFTSFAEIALGPYYLQDFRYQKSVREIRKMTETFLEEWGFPQASSFALTFATMFEYDNAYLFRVQDIANETSNEALTKDPVKELSRLFKIFSEREMGASLMKRAKAFYYLLRIAFMIPKVKRAFVKAVQAADIEKIKMDEADLYHILRWDNHYKFLGRDLEDRIGEFMMMHKGVPPKVSFIGG